MKLWVGIAIGLVIIGVGGLLLPHAIESRQLKWRSIDWEAGRDEERPSLPADLLPEPDVHSLGDGKVKWFKQAVAGIPVEGTFVKVVEKSGQPTLIQGQVLDADQLPAESSVGDWLRSADKNRGHRVSTAQSQGCRKIGELTAVLENYKGRWRLVYQMDCEKNYEVLQLALAPNGEFLGSKPVTYDFVWGETSVVIYPKGPALSPLQSLTLPVSADPLFLQTPNMTVQSDANVSFADIKSLSEVTPTDERFDMVQAYHFAKEALDWAEKTLNVSLSQLKIRTHVGYPDHVSVAFYYGGEVRLGTGDNISFRNMTWDPTVVVHETMHAVVEKLTHMAFQGEAGSLSEALADSLTSLHLQTPKMGEASYLNGPYQRSLEQRILFQDKKAKLYHDSLILSGTIWQLREEVSPEIATDLTIFLLKHLNPSSDFARTKEQIQNWFSNCSSGEVCHRIGSILSGRGWLEPN